MEKEVIRKVHELLSSFDKELIQLGAHIFLSKNPTNEDINELNNQKNSWSILGTYEQEKIDNIVENLDNLKDIL